jgi:hypothetical protein
MTPPTRPKKMKLRLAPFMGLRRYSNVLAMDIRAEKHMGAIVSSIAEGSNLQYPHRALTWL